MSPTVHVASLVCVVMEIRAMGGDDWPAVEEIYAEGIATRLATFETATPTFAEFDAESRPPAPPRRRRRGPRGRLGGALAHLASRLLRGRRGAARCTCARTRAAEASVGCSWTLSFGARTTAGIWTIQTSMFPENEASLALHEKLGFRVVGRRERIAQLDGVWRDTILLERRA